jgi:hypothetical protein
MNEPHFSQKRVLVAKNGTKKNFDRFSTEIIGRPDVKFSICFCV